MIGLTANAAVSTESCSNAPLLVNVVASNDIAPAVQSVASSFNNQNVTSGGRCVQVQVDQADSATEAGQIDGQARSQGPAVDAWIPDSSLWVDVARTYAPGAQAVQRTGTSIARSPLMLVATKAVATQTGIFAEPPTWNLLLPSADGGPPASLGLTVDLPDPASSATGLASLTEVSRLLGTGPAERTGLTALVRGVQTTQSVNSPSLLTQFAQLPGKSVTVATEQAVLAYDKTSPKVPLAAQYASSSTQSLGTPELDYPYVLTTAQPAAARAATKFGDYLQTPYAQSVMRYDGFRSANGQLDVMPKSADLAGQPLQLATAISPKEAATNLQAWQQLGLGFRELILADVSPAMDQPSGDGSMNVLTMLDQTASGGLGLYPDSTQMGVWTMGESPSASDPYQQLVSMGALSADFGMIVRRTQLQDIIATLKPSANGTLAMHTAILDAYEQMTKSYLAGYENNVIVLTSGVDSARGDISLSSLLAQIHHLANPAKPVGIVILMFGTQGNFGALQQIAAAAPGGTSFHVTSPAQIGQIFIDNMSQRLCSPSCG